MAKRKNRLVAIAIKIANNQYGEERMAKWIGTTTIGMAKIKYLKIRGHFP